MWTETTTNCQIIDYKAFEFFSIVLFFFKLCSILHSWMNKCSFIYLHYLALPALIKCAYRVYTYGTMTEWWGIHQLTGLNTIPFENKYFISKNVDLKKTCTEYYFCLQATHTTVLLFYNFCSPLIYMVHIVFHMSCLPLT